MVSLSSACHCRLLLRATLPLPPLLHPLSGSLTCAKMAGNEFATWPNTVELVFGKVAFFKPDCLKYLQSHGVVVSTLDMLFEVPDHSALSAEQECHRRKRRRRTIGAARLSALDPTVCHLHRTAASPVDTKYSRYQSPRGTGQGSSLCG